MLLRHGADPTIKDLVPSDIEIRRNHLAKPLAWKAGEPAYEGRKWSVKNLLELKEALGEAIKPYLQEGPLGPHIPCREVDTSGAFVELTVEGQNAQGQKVALFFFRGSWCATCRAASASPAER